jgi:hypothetical protein
MAKTTSQKIEAAKAEIQQMENQLKLLMQKYKEEEQKKRTHRICQRGGYLEKVLPDTIALTEDNFKAWLDLTLASDTGKEFLAELIAEQEKQAAENGADADPQGGGKPADAPPKPTAPATAAPATKAANLAQNGGANAHASHANNSNIAASASDANGANPGKQAV